MSPGKEASSEARKLARAPNLSARITAGEILGLECAPNLVFAGPANLNQLVVGSVFDEHDKRQVLLEAVLLSRDDVRRMEELDGLHRSEKFTFVPGAESSGDPASVKCGRSRDVVFTRTHPARRIRREARDPLASSGGG